MNTDEKACNMMMVALQNIGYMASRIHGHVAIRVRNFGNRGYVNVDLAREVGHTILVAVYSLSDGITHVAGLRTRLIDLADKFDIYDIIKGNFWDPNNPNREHSEREEGVVFKLNTRLDWRIADENDFREAAARVKALVEDVVSPVWG